MARKKYFSFICEDAKDSLRLLVKGKNLKSDDKVFPTGYSGLRKKVMNAAEHIGIYKNGNGKQSFRLHTYRKRGQTILEDVHVPLNWVDRILGHVPRGAQGQTYSLPPLEKLRAEYTKAVSQLTIYGTPLSLVTSDVSEELRDQRIRKIVRETFEELLQKASNKEIVQLQQLLKSRK